MPPDRGMGKEDVVRYIYTMEYSVQFSCSVMPDSLQPHGLQHTRPPCPSPTPGVHSNSRTLSQWCHPAISSSVVPFCCLQSFPASGSFQMSQFFASGDQNIGVSASASVLPMNIQGWLISFSFFLQSKALSRVFSSTTVWKHGFNFHGSKNMLSHWICHDAPEGRDISESFLLLDFSPSRRMVRQWFFSRSLMGNTKQLHRELKFTIF